MTSRVLAIRNTGSELNSPAPIPIANPTAFNLLRTCQQRNPSDLGYLAGYAAAHLASGTPMQAGSSFSAGSLNKTYTMAQGNGELSVVLGLPTVFDKSNIDQFSF